MEGGKSGELTAAQRTKRTLTNIIDTQGVFGKDKRE